MSVETSLGPVESLSVLGEPCNVFTTSSSLGWLFCSRISSSSKPSPALPCSERNLAAQETALPGIRNCFEISSSLCQAPSTICIQTYQRSIGRGPLGNDKRSRFEPFLPYPTN